MNLSQMLHENGTSTEVILAENCYNYFIESMFNCFVIVSLIKRATTDTYMCLHLILYCDTKYPLQCQMTIVKSFKGMYTDCLKRNFTLLNFFPPYPFPGIIHKLIRLANPELSCCDSSRCYYTPGPALLFWFRQPIPLMMCH